MSNEVDLRITPKVEESKKPETPQDKELDQVANDAAQKAGKTEQHYDRDHNIFTK